MWCPSASLSMWANAWLAGSAAPDDVLDALSQWARKHSVTAYDAVAAGNTGLPWPDLSDSGTVSLLQTLRTAAGPRTWAPAISVVLPVPGDVRGLPAGTQFERDAVAAGEAIVVAPEPGSSAVGLVPDFEYEDVDPDEFKAEFEPEMAGLCWTAYSLPAAPITEQIELGEAEYALRSAVRSAADALGALRTEAGGVDVADPRGLVEQVMESSGRHRAPDHAPSRALRVLENAAHIDAIVTVSSGLMPIGLQSSSEAQIANDALRPLAAVVRSARSAALNTILHSAWQS
jgi:hypothetical protein